MTINQLISQLPIRLASGDGRSEVTALVEDSRGATPGSLFVARVGTNTDGRRFIPEAVRQGAAAVLTDRPVDLPPGACLLLSDDVPLAEAMLAERLAGSPSRSLKMLAVTGTNGKTTITYLVRHLLNSGGLRCGLIGTVEIDDGRARAAADYTTPPAMQISRHLQRMTANGCGACVMEASSHAIHQKRIAALEFQVAVFTNLTGDHLDYHKTMDQYAAAKASLFESLPAQGTAVLNVDDPAHTRMARDCKAQLLGCSLHQEKAQCLARIHHQTISHAEVEFRGPWGHLALRLPVIGRHNVMNALQAAAAAHAAGLSPAQIRRGLETCEAPPGRLQPVSSPGDDVTVLVDYAHSDDALRNVLSTLRPLVPDGARLRVLFGCGGDRDRTKRPRMAAVACELADDVVITSDNPRTEDPDAIIAEILTGVPSRNRGCVEIQGDREAAIGRIIAAAGPGDVLLIAGKGHEDYQIIGKQKRPFDDRLIARSVLARTRSAAGVHA